MSRVQRGEPVGQVSPVRTQRGVRGLQRQDQEVSQLQGNDFGDDSDDGNDNDGDDNQYVSQMKVTVERKTREPGADVNIKTREELKQLELKVISSSFIISHF